MASPARIPSAGEEGPAEQQAAPSPPYVALPVSQLGSKLQYVPLGAPGPSGIKQCFRTVKTARRVATLPERPAPARRTRRDRAKRHACAACDKRFSSPGKLSQHLLSHTGELPFSCEFCDKKFNSKFKLVRHSLIHSEARAFACTVCGKTFNRKDHLSNHVRVHNPVKKMYTCERPDCRKSYTSHLSYRKHAALHSAEEGNLQCEICDDTFDTQQEIVYHLKVHTGSRTIKNETDRKFTCDHCDRKFFTAKDVRRHLVVHTGRRDFLCPHCPQKFGRKDHLVRHVKNAHPEESWRSAAVGTSQDPPLPEETFPEPFIVEGTSFDVWKLDDHTKEIIVEGRTRVPSSDIIVEIPSELDIKVEPLDSRAEESVEVKLEQPASPLLPAEYPVYLVPPEHFLPAEPPLLEPSLLEPGPSGLPRHILRELLEQSEFEDARPQRLPAFTQAFHRDPPPQPPPSPPR